MTKFCRIRSGARQHVSHFLKKIDIYCAEAPAGNLNEIRKCVQIGSRGGDTMAVEGVVAAADVVDVAVEVLVELVVVEKAQKNHGRSRSRRRSKT